MSKLTDEEARADVVVAVSRNKQGRATVRILKNRNGPTGTCSAAVACVAIRDALNAIGGGKS